MYSSSVSIVMLMQSRVVGLCCCLLKYSSSVVSDVLLVQCMMLLCFLLLLLLVEGCMCVSVGCSNRVVGIVSSGIVRNIQCQLGCWMIRLFSVGLIIEGIIQFVENVVNIFGCRCLGQLWLIIMYSEIEIVFVFRFCSRCLVISMFMCMVKLVSSRFSMKQVRLYYSGCVGFWWLVQCLVRVMLIMLVVSVLLNVSVYRCRLLSVLVIVGIVVVMVNVLKVCSVISVIMLRVVVWQCVDRIDVLVGRWVLVGERVGVILVRGGLCLLMGGEDSSMLF